MFMKFFVRLGSISVSLLTCICFAMIGRWGIVTTGQMGQTKQPVMQVVRLCAGASSTCTWHIVHSPNVGQNSNELYSLAALSMNDAWAVGAANAADGQGQPLIEHWNDKAWSAVAAPKPNASFSYLQGVSAVSKDDVWAVGSTGEIQTLVEHWDGKLWRIVPSPDSVDPHPGGILDSVVALSTNDVWAAGFYTDTTINAVKTLIEHWNGKVWSIVSTPNLTSYNILYSITSVSANNVWAVGSYTYPINGGSLALVEHWDGKVWSVVSTPAVSSSNNVLLLSVSALSAHDVWAVGSYNTSGYSSNTLVEHWDGSQWSIMSGPTFKTSTTLSGVTTLSKNNVWAVGNSFDASNPNGVSTTLIEHWNGKAWNVVQSPNPHGQFATLNTVARLPGTSSLLAGGYCTLPSSTKNNVVEQTLVEQYR